MSENKPYSIKEMPEEFFLRTNHKYAIVDEGGSIVAKVEGLGIIYKQFAEHIVECLNKEE